ncbi:hypothetical protein [Tianweitania sp.]|uniref:hypothetical protein n=1 Tax=Tianweitania sp. TaxID=2021634 RepID=UPI0028A01A3A|nr:hypothetical protein [Tianweitania sp.]
MLNQLRTFVRFLRKYFKAYGGWGAVFGSPLFIVAVLVTGLNFPNWSDRSWVALAQSIIPSLLGFSLGTYAILFSIISARLKGALRTTKAGHGYAYLEVINATFFHFIFVQVIALLWSLLATGDGIYQLSYFIGQQFSWNVGVFRTLRLIGLGAGYLLLVYSLVLVISASLVIYRLALLRDPAESQDR